MPNAQATDKIFNPALLYSPLFSTFRKCSIEPRPMKKIRIHHYLGKTIDTNGRSTWESIQVELLVGAIFSGIALSMYRLGSTVFFYRRRHSGTRLRYQLRSYPVLGFQRPVTMRSG